MVLRPSQFPSELNESLIEFLSCVMMVNSQSVTAVTFVLPVHYQSKITMDSTVSVYKVPRQVHILCKACLR